MNEPAAMNCDDFDRALAAYRSDLSSEQAAQRLEWHASRCARCELLLDHATKRAVTFAPSLPSDLRASVLQAITAAPVLTIVREAESRSATPPQADRTRARRRVLLSLLAVAATLAVVVVSQRDAPDASSVASTAPADAARVTEHAPPITAPVLDHDVGFVYTAARVASAQAQAEFEALDDAAQELELALAQTPNDRELRAFLSSVRARRDELTRRVREATS